MTQQPVRVETGRNMSQLGVLVPPPGEFTFELDSLHRVDNLIRR